MKRSIDLGFLKGFPLVAIVDEEAKTVTAQVYDLDYYGEPYVFEEATATCQDGDTFSVSKGIHIAKLKLVQKLYGNLKTNALNVVTFLEKELRKHKSVLENADKKLQNVKSSLKTKHFSK